MTTISIRSLRLFCVAALLAASTVYAKPYRVMVTRTAESVKGGNLELGLRYQGFFSLATDVLPYQQLSPSVRLGIFDNLEFNMYLEVLALGLPGQSTFAIAFGDIPLALQWTFLKTQPFALGVYVRGTIPTGPSTFDFVHPGLSDGTWDGEGTLVAELRPTKDLRFMLNAGYLYHGTRDRGALPDFDVPEAVQAGVAGAFNLDRLTLIGLEVVARYYLQPAITPVWTNNDLQVEVIPVVRREVLPGLVLEAVAGVAVTPDLRSIYQFRGLLGFTYEWDLAKGPDLPERAPKGKHGRKRGK